MVTFQAYSGNTSEKTGKTLDEFRKTAYKTDLPTAMPWKYTQPYTVRDR